MSHADTLSKIFELNASDYPRPTDQSPVRAHVVEIRDDGLIGVRMATGSAFLCECLDNLIAEKPLQAGDRVLALLPVQRNPGVVLGRIGRHHPPTPVRNLQLHATDSLSLTCGAASMELRSDGKLVIRGDDVLVRARGTQRIKAATVSIN